MIAAFLCITTVIASTAFSYRELHPAALFPYYRAAVESDIARAYVNPAELGGNPSFFIDMNYARPYGFEGLSASALYCSASSATQGALVAWQSFGIDEYREDVLETAYGCTIMKLFRVGAAASLSRLRVRNELVDFTDYLCNFRGGISFTPIEWISLAYHQENVRSIFAEEARDIHYPGWSAGIRVNPARGVSMSWNVNKTYFSYVNSFAISANILKYLSASGGYSRETATLAGAITVFVRGISASYGLRYHSYLGATHSFSVAYQYQSPPLEEIAYAKPRKRSCEGIINLASCNADDLKAAGVAEHIAARIIAYREKIGPVSKRALIQMGLTTKEYKRLLPCLQQLADDGADGNKKLWEAKKEKIETIKAHKKPLQEYPYRNAEARKLLFQKLLDAGVKASSSLRLCELAKDLTQQKLLDTIKHIDFLSEQEKTAARKACLER
jgi:hypothetical protein